MCVEPSLTRLRAGEWRNPGVSAANVSILERCWGGDTSCTGIAAWRLTNPASPAVEAVTSFAFAAATPKTLAAVTTPVTIAFVVSPARNATLTKMSGTAAAGAPVTISIMPYSAYDPGQLASLGNSTDWAGNWTTLYNSSWPGSGAASVQQVTFGTPFPVTAGTNYTVMVSTNNQTSSTTLTCLHWLGNVTSTLFSDSTLTVYQGGGFSWPAFNYNNSFFPTKMCAWNKLIISYDQQLDASCAPPPPPPLPPPLAIPTNAPAALVASLDDLIRALANTNVTSIDIRAAIRLNSTLTIAVDPGTTRTLTILGTAACNTADPRVLLCSLDAGGLSSVMTVPNNVSLTLGNLAVMNGLSAAGVSGGCILADCATCSLTISAAVFTNCTARTSGNGGAIVMRNRGTLTVRNSLFQQNTAAHGGAIMVFNATATITGTTFSYNTATIATTSTTVVAASDLVGPSGGALSLQVATATVTSCTFTNNLAMSTDFVLVANPDLPQARGGGLFISQSVNVVVSTSTFTGNQAYYGGGIYAVSTPQLQLLSSVLTNNTASLGDGGGTYLQDCINATVADSLVANNAAGGHMGGGLAAFNSQKVNLLTIVRSSFSFNSAPSGCGGGLGFDTPVILIINQSTVISGNTARSGGGLCCNLCTRIDLQNSFLFNNVATLVGGGAMTVTNAPAYLVNVSMSFNNAPQGGAIFSTSSYFKLENSSLSNNTATTTHGGAISHASLDDGKQDLILLWSNLTGNTCEGGGGAVAAFSTRTLVLNNCNLLYNSIYGDNPMGGAVMALGITRMFMRNSTVAYNIIAVVPTLTTNSPLGFINGVNAIGAGNGGALWIGNALRVPVIIAGTTFTRNSAPSAGAIYVTGNVRLDIQLCSFFHDHSIGYASRGGAIVSTQSATVDVADTYFFSCESNGGGVAWHGGTSASTYTRVIFEENEGIPGADMKGTVLQVAESSFVNITDSTFLNNIGVDLADGTVAFVGDSTSSLYISNTLFDGNFAYLGGCLFTVRACCCSARRCDSLARACPADGCFASVADAHQRRQVHQQLRLCRLCAVHRGGGLCAAGLQPTPVRHLRSQQLREQLRPSLCHPADAVQHQHPRQHSQRSSVACHHHAGGWLRHPGVRLDQHCGHHREPGGHLRQFADVLPTRPGNVCQPRAAWRREPVVQHDLFYLRAEAVRQRRRQPKHVQIGAGSSVRARRIVRHPRPGVRVRSRIWPDQDGQHLPRVCCRRGGAGRLAFVHGVPRAEHSCVSNHLRMHSRLFRGNHWCVEAARSAA